MRFYRTEKLSYHIVKIKSKAISLEPSLLPLSAFLDWQENGYLYLPHHSMLKMCKQPPPPQAHRRREIPFEGLNLMSLISVLDAFKIVFQTQTWWNGKTFKAFWNRANIFSMKGRHEFEGSSKENLVFPTNSLVESPSSYVILFWGMTYRNKKFKRIF